MKIRRILALVLALSLAFSTLTVAIADEAFEGSGMESGSASEGFEGESESSFGEAEAPEPEPPEDGEGAGASGEDEGYIESENDQGGGSDLDTGADNGVLEDADGYPEEEYPEEEQQPGGEMPSTVVFDMSGGVFEYSGVNESALFALGIDIVFMDDKGYHYHGFRHPAGINCPIPGDDVHVVLKPCYRSAQYLCYLFRRLIWVDALTVPTGKTIVDPNRIYRRSSIEVAGYGHTMCGNSSVRHVRRRSLANVSLLNFIISCTSAPRAPVGVVGHPVCP